MSADDAPEVPVGQPDEIVPEGEPAPVLVSPPTAEPTPTVSAADASWSHPPGSAAPSTAPPAGDALADRPEVLVGAAFAGGLVFAMLLKRLGR